MLLGRRLRQSRVAVALGDERLRLRGRHVLACRLVLRLQPRLVDEHIHARRSLRQRLVGCRVARDHQRRALGVEPPGISVLDGIVVDLDRRGPPVVALDALARRDLAHVDAPRLIGQAGGEAADLDVPVQQPQEIVHVLLQARRADQAERPLVEQDPARDQEVAEVDAVVRVHVGDEHGVYVARAVAGLDQAPHRTRAAVDQDAVVAHAHDLARPRAPRIGDRRAGAQ